MKIYKVRINYKSGRSVEAWFKKFDIQGNIHDGLTKITWTQIPGMGPQPTFLNVAEIESIWTIKEQERELETETRPEKETAGY